MALLVSNQSLFRKQDGLALGCQRLGLGNPLGSADPAAPSARTQHLDKGLDTLCFLRLPEGPLPASEVSSPLPPKDSCSRPSPPAAALGHLNRLPIRSLLCSHRKISEAGIPTAFFSLVF